MNTVIDDDDFLLLTESEVITLEEHKIGLSPQDQSVSIPITVRPRSKKCSRDLNIPDLHAIETNCPKLKALNTE